VSDHANPALLTAYLDSLRTQRQLSPHTLANYRRDLLQLASFAGTSELAGISHFDIRKFAAKLHAQGLNPRSIARQLSTWRGFYRWLSEQTVLAANPVDGVKAPRRAKTLPKALSADDAVRLVAFAPTAADSAPDQAQLACNRAMFELLYSSGLRVSELVGLDIHHVHQGEYTSLGWIDSEAHEVVVTGKGNKMRSVPVGQPALDAIADWLLLRPQLANSSAGAADQFALFLGGRGKRISARLVQLRLKAHAQALGIPANVHPHVLRHSFASHVLQSSGDLRAVQEMLGHASIASTQIYTSLDFQRLAQVYDVAHPRAKKK
jgi:integrase/recombinase XerC